MIVKARTIAVVPGLVVATLVLALMQCGRGPEPPALIRLVDLLPEAEIVSPLTSVPAAESLSETRGVVKSSVVFREGFDPLAPHPEGWLHDPGCEKELVDSGNGVLQCTGRWPHLMLLPAEPSTHYRLSRQARATASECGDVILSESAGEYTPPRRPWIVFRRGLKRGRLLARYRFSSAGPSWTRDSQMLLTTPHTRSLVIGAYVKPNCQLRLDSLTLERLDLSVEQKLSLIKAQSPAPGTDRTLGVAKRGRFLIAESESVPSPYDENYTVRDVLFAPTPTDITFDLVIPPRARLYFSYAIGKWADAGDEVRFEITLGLGDLQKTLFSDILRADAGSAERYWRQARIDLEEYAGRKVRLTFKTRSSTDGLTSYPLWGSPILDRPRSPSDPPNVILLVVDTLRADRLGSYGSRTVSTPHIDSLARDGILFDPVVSQASWTLPSHASVFTGLMPSRHGAGGHSVLSSLPLRFDTLAEHFQAAGWSTHAILYKPALADVGVDQGFDTFFNVPKVAVQADDNLRKALEWLDENHDRRFFLLLHFDDPHQPYAQPEEFLNRQLEQRMARFDARLPLIVNSRFARNFAPGTPKLRGHKKGKTLKDSFKALSRDLYDSEVEYVDDRIGQFLEALRQRGLYDETIIVFFSDHGEAYWEHGEVFGHEPRNFYEEVVRVPLIIKPADRHPFRRGQRVRSQVRLFDLMPTVLEMAGLETSGLPIQARSLIPLMQHSERTWPDRLAITEARSGLAVRSRGWKYMLRSLGSRKGELLFRLDDDSSEVRDVHRERPELTRALRLAGLENRLWNQRGRYAVVVGDTSPRRYVVEMKMASSSPLPEVLYGLDQEAEESGTDTRTHRFAGYWQRPLVLVARLPGVAEPQISARAQAVAKGNGALALEQQRLVALARTEEAGFLQRLVDRAVPGVYVLDLEGADGESQRSPSSVADARRLEALRALGYLD